MQTPASLRKHSQKQSATGWLQSAGLKSEVQAARRGEEELKVNGQLKGGHSLMQLHYSPVGRHQDINSKIKTFSLILLLFLLMSFINITNIVSL